MIAFQTYQELLLTTLKFKNLQRKLSIMLELHLLGMVTISRHSPRRLLATWLVEVHLLETQMISRFWPRRHSATWVVELVHLLETQMISRF